MRAPISVVIPTLDAAPQLAACLAALVEGLEAGLIRELIVSDGGSGDDTIALADAWGAQVVSGPASRGGQLRRGVAAAQGHWVLVLHADTVLQEGWSGVVAEHLNSSTCAGWFVAGWANLRSRLGLPYGDQGLLLPRSLYDAVGGYADQPLMEDVAMARSLRGRLVRLDAVAVTSAAKYRQQGWVRRGARNLWTLVRYACGVSPARLAQAYRR